MYSNDLVRGTLRTIVLKLLEQNGRMYGYEITQRVEELTEGKIKLTFGALYPTLHKLEAEKLLSIKKVEVDNRIRKYYQLTTQGKVVAVDKVREFSDFLKTMQLLILS